MCADCTKCANGDLMLRRCTEFSNTVCQSSIRCTCSDGFYISKPCQGGDHAECTKVSYTTCPRGFYMEASATSTSDIVCLMCPQSCAEGFFQQSPPRSTSKMSGRCTFECMPCGTCGRGSERLRECNATSNVTCKSCKSVCQDEYTYEVETCWDKVPVTCDFCASPVDGFYVPPGNKCSGRRNHLPVRCKYHAGDPERTCNASNYVARSCKYNPGENSWFSEDVSTCQECQAKKICSPGQMFVNCSGTAAYDDSACVACPGNKRTCNKGQYFSAECTCTNCAVQSRNCTSASFYNGCNGDGSIDDGECSDTTFNCGPVVCNGETNYYAKRCNAKTRTLNECGMCHTKATVPPGFFISRPCSLDNSSEISRCTYNASRSRCIPGVSRVVRCTETSDWTCVPCRKSTLCNLAFSYIAGCSDGGESDYTCVQRTDIRAACPSGMYRKQGKKLFFFDMHATACPSGMYRKLFFFDMHAIDIRTACPSGMYRKLFFFLTCMQQPVSVACTGNCFFDMHATACPSGMYRKQGKKLFFF